jgi:hypothetical protein
MLHDGVRHLAEAFFLAKPFRNKKPSHHLTLAFRVTSRIAKFDFHGEMRERHQLLSSP